MTVGRKGGEKNSLLQSAYWTSRNPGPSSLEEFKEIRKANGNIVVEKFGEVQSQGDSEQKTEIKVARVEIKSFNSCKLPMDAQDRPPQCEGPPHSLTSSKDRTSVSLSAICATPQDCLE